MSFQLPGWIKELLGKEPPTQASLFHYIKTEPEPSVWSTLDFSVLRHPIQFIKFIKEEWKAPRTRPSLFHYIEEEDLVGQEFTWKEFFRDLFFGSPPPAFIPGVLSDRVRHRRRPEGGPGGAAALNNYFISAPRSPYHACNHHSSQTDRAATT